MKSFLLSLLAVLFSASALSAADWVPDSLILNDGFEMRTVSHPDDYSGKVVSTVIRKLAPGNPSKAVLYVHGFNDYFFQQDMADRFVEKGFSFYAVDLRKYGRSLLPGQKRFQVRDISEYFADIDSAVSIMQTEGIDEIILIGHSTGGLTSSLYMAEKNPPIVRALILNSPFLDWNLSPFLEKFAVPVIVTLGATFPNMKIPQGGGTGYSDSLLEGYGGEWNYSTYLKLRKSPDVDAGWIRAIDLAQHKLQSMSYPIYAPILLMHSSKSIEEGNDGDAVLDVDDISRYGRNLGCNLDVMVVPDGLHDLILSKNRDSIYSSIFNWLSSRNL